MSISIGTCIRRDNWREELRQAAASGFETVELYCNVTLGGLNLTEAAAEIRDAGLHLSAIGLYGNPLASEENRTELTHCIELARSCGAASVSTFAGALPGKSVGDTVRDFQKVFGELAKRAEDAGVRIGLENAHMYGHWYQPTWNIAFCPRAWELLFDAVPSPALGLTWEPSHQLEQLIDPIAQLKTWHTKVVHIHGKDASIDREALRRWGAWFGMSYCAHRFPGRGECDWTDILRILEGGGYQGSLCVEGFHDRDYDEGTEFDGQREALAYLRACQRRLS